MLFTARPLHPPPDPQTLEQSAREYTPEHVGQFLEKIGLGHHVTVFTEGDISGEVLLEATEEMLKELGVSSPTERLKIKVNAMEGLTMGIHIIPSPY